MGSRGQRAKASCRLIAVTGFFAIELNLMAEFLSCSARYKPVL